MQDSAYFCSDLLSDCKLTKNKGLDNGQVFPKKRSGSIKLTMINRQHAPGCHTAPAFQIRQGLNEEILLLRSI